MATSMLSLNCCDLFGSESVPQSGPARSPRRSSGRRVVRRRHEWPGRRRRARPRSGRRSGHGHQNSMASKPADLAVAARSRSGRSVNNIEQFARYGRRRCSIESPFQLSAVPAGFHDTETSSRIVKTQQPLSTEARGPRRSEGSTVPFDRRRRERRKPAWLPRHVSEPHGAEMPSLPVAPPCRRHESRAPSAGRLRPGTTSAEASADVPTPQCWRAPTTR